MTIETIRKAIESHKARSAWKKGVTGYALEILAEVEERTETEGHAPADIAELKEYMLNGAQDFKHPEDLFKAWTNASYGGKL